MDHEIIGYLAAIFTTAAYVPQFLKVVKDRDTRSLSLGMYSLITTGIALWLVYGILIDSPSIILANAITLVLASIILVMKIRLG
jgi:MtN3 and saliva related transmembrane protein